MPGLLHPEYDSRPAPGRDGGVDFMGEPLFVIPEEDGVWVYSVDQFINVIQDSHYTDEGLNLDAGRVKLPGDIELYQMRTEVVGEVQQDLDPSGDFVRGESWILRVYALMEGMDSQVIDLNLYVKDH